jgi:serine/threonine-protein kinase
MGPECLVDGRYRVLRELGSGGMGQVFEARDVHLQRTVAIKQLRTGTSSNSLEAFHREARALASLRHRSIPAIHAFGVHGAAPFFVMERIDGVSLDVIVDEHARHDERIPAHRAVSIVRRLASALGAAHAAGILHRDVKPENVLIEGETGRPVLVDFGIATRAEDRSTTGRIAGTPEFMAPENWRGEGAGVATDIYSLGCLAFELLTGRVPFQVDSLPSLRLAHLEQPPPAPSSIAKDLAPYDPVLARALAKAPGDRYPTCAAFEVALANALAPPANSDDALVTEILPHTSGAIRILVVDDDPIFAMVAARCAKVAFVEGNVAVSRAASGWSAVHNAERWMPQLLLLDYNLPELDGVEVLSRIRELPGGESVSVIVMSGAVGKAERYRFSALGVREILEKPVSFDVLVDTIVRRSEARGWLPRAGQGASRS